MPIMMIFAVVVIALIVVAGIFAGHELLSTNQLSSAQTAISLIVSRTQQTFAQQPDYSGLVDQIMNYYPVTLHLVPANMVMLLDTNYGLGYLGSPFNGSLEVYNAGPSVGNSAGAGLERIPSFGVQFDHLTVSECTQLASTVTAYDVFVGPDMTNTMKGTGPGNYGIGYPVSANSTKINPAHDEQASPSAAEADCKASIGGQDGIFDSLAFIYTKAD